MNNNTNIPSGERLSFYKLFCEKRYRISIPIIQRDYAQGRQTTTEVRTIFLDALSGYLKENKPNRDLDFVYGSLNETGGITDFIPLDGQQRLTTLFLLHWYLYQISENIERKAEFKSFLQKDGKSMFTYETRSSSSEFCDALIGNDINFNNLVEADKDDEGKSKENSLSKTIEDSFWFFLSWKYDPTIQSMLTMIDAIHSKFADKKEYFERLIDIEKPIITFLFLNLKDFKLTDDLYIKMNSRGKPLTSFENFKAKFEQHLEGIKTNRKFNLIYDKDKKEDDVSLKKYFSYNIDTKWANLFWAYRELAGDKDVYDEELKNFIRVILANQYAISNENNDKFEFLLGTQVAKKRKDYTNNISYYKYKELDAVTERSILYLIDAFDNLVNENNKIKTYLSESYKFYFDENTVFENAIKHSFKNYPERVIFHAYIRFLIENKNDRTGIEQWIRVIHNLANNTIIDGAERISGAIKSVEKLLPKSNDILKYLSEKPSIDFFSSWQVLEEKIKAHLINKAGWKDKIENTEKIDCFAGQIGFLLEFSGIVEYYEKNFNCDWTEQEDKKYLDSFKNYADNAIAVFEKKNNYNTNFVWERAVLTKGDYLMDDSSWRKNLLTTGDKGDFSWKRLLRIKNDEDEKKLATKRILVKKVFDDDLFDKNDLQNSLEKICECKTNTWRDYLIICPDLIRYCKQGFIRFVNENDIILMGQSQMNHRHSEMYSYYLWKQYIESRKEEFKSFKKIDYCYVKSSEEDACVVLGDFCHDKVYYEINIYYCNIAFRKSKGENAPGRYGDDIKNILTKLNFEWRDDYCGYFFTSEDNNTLMGKLERLNEEIEKL